MVTESDAVEEGIEAKECMVIVLNYVRKHKI